MANKNTDYYFFDGGGEMGELIRAKDWSKTALGDPADWPRSLCTMLAVMLDNPFGMYIAWGNEYIQFYNDAYRPILGATKHPQALGISTHETFSEIWHIIGPMFDGVMKGKAVGFPDFMLPLNRNGFTEECYFDFAYSPIRKDNGEVGGVLVTVIETTDKRKAQVALVENSTQLKFAMDAAELGAWDYNPATNKFTANNRLKTWFGLSASEEIELHHATDAIAEKDRDRIIMAIKNVLDYSSGGIYEEEYSIINPLTNKEIIVHGKGRVWFNEERIAYRFNGVLQEVTENVLARKKIEDSEKQKEFLLKLSDTIRQQTNPDGIEAAVTNIALDFLEVDWCHFCIVEGDNVIIHHDAVRGTLPSVVGSYPVSSYPLFKAILDNGHPFVVDNVQTTQILDAALKQLCVQLQNMAFINVPVIKNGKPVAILSLVQSEPRNWKDAEVQLTIAIAERSWAAIERTKAEKTLLKSEEKYRTLFNSIDQGFLLGELIRNNEGKGIDYYVHEVNATYEKQTGINIELVLGKTVRQAFPTIDKWWIETYASVVDNQCPVRFEKFFEFTNRWFEIKASPAGKEMFTILFTDITESRLAVEKIKESEEQFSTLADNMENLAWLANEEGWIYWYNKRWLAYTGLSLEEMQGWGWQKVHHPDHVERIVEISKKLWHSNETFELTFPLRRHDGEYRWFLTRGFPVTNEEGKITRWIGTNTDIDEQKKAEDQFRVLADQAPMWVWLTDKAVNVLYANSELLRFIGISHYTEFTGHMWERKVHPEDIEKVYKSFAAAANLQQSFAFEFRVQNAITQKYEWFYIKGVPRLEAGDFAGFIGTGVNINEQKLVLSQLEYRKALLEAHNEASIDGILLVDTKGKILSYNHCFVEIWNIPQQILDDNDDEKALAFVLTQLVNPEAFIQKVKWLYENTNEKSKDELEFKDGKVIERHGYHVTGADGTYYGCSWIFREITKQKKSERIVKESEERFRSLAQTLPQLVWMTDAQGNQEFASSRWREYSGIKPDGEKEWREIVHPEDYDNINAAWIHSLTTGNIYTFNVRLRSKHGVYKWHLVKGEPILDQENKIVKWVGSFTDIHEHKKAEEQFRQMAERMPQKVWTADAQGNRNYFNQTMLNYTGSTFEELKDWGWKKTIHPDDWPATKQKWEQSIETGEDFENKNRLLRKDGKYLWHLVRATAIKDEEGNPKIWIGSKTEIQEQIELSDSLSENLKESDKRMQTILKHAPDAVISIDEDGIIKSWNSEAELIFGWKEHEVIEKTLTETIIPMRYRDGHNMGMKHFLSTGEGPVINKPIEMSALKKNGGEFPVELKISTSKINDRYLFIGFLRDISTRKEAEETIQNKTNQLEEAQQLAHIGSWEWDVQTNDINWSDELYRIYGLTPQQLNTDYEHMLKYIDTGDRDTVHGIIQQAFKDHQPYNFFYKAVCADGKIRVLSATGKVFTDTMGNVIKMSGTVQDVTEQKKYEEELKISEERFFKIFDSNPIPMSLTEIKTNKIKYANTLFYKAFGYTKEEVIGNSTEDLNLIDSEEYKRVINLIFGYLQEQRSLAEVQALSKEETEALLLKLNESEKMKDFEILYTRKNGETFPALVSFEVLRIGIESYTVTSYQDITLRKKAEIQLRNQNDQLEKMNEELQSFAYISSHDLQEPLRKIQTFATRILEKEENNLSDYGKDMFNRMQNAAKRMQTLIQDLLAYSRTNTTEAKFETADLNEIISEVKDDLKEELKEKHATIEAQELCEAVVIPFQFRQLMHNLIGNALKFSYPNQPPVIKISSEIANGSKFNHEKLLPQKKYCHISVSDNGIGFEQKFSEKIFEVFQRLHGKHEYDGTGIGLAIVKKIVENHHGYIVATGALNKGAAFDIYIPAP